MAGDEDAKDEGTVGAITKLFPDLGYDLIARLPVGILALVLTYWITASKTGARPELPELAWPPAVALLLLLFPMLHTIGVVVSAVSWTLIAWWLRPLVYLYLVAIKAGVKDRNWRKANKLEIDAFRAVRRKKDQFVSVMTKSRAEMALATNLLSTYLLMTGIAIDIGAPVWSSRTWVGLGMLLFVAAVSRTRSYFGWLFT